MRLATRPTPRPTCRKADNPIGPMVDTFTFTPANWSKPQTVALITLNDRIATGNLRIDTLLTAGSSDRRTMRLVFLCP